MHLNRDIFISLGVSVYTIAGQIGQDQKAFLKISPDLSPFICSLKREKEREKGFKHIMFCDLSLILWLPRSKIGFIRNYY